VLNFKLKIFKKTALRHLRKLMI